MSIQTRSLVKSFQAYLAEMGQLKSIKVKYKWHEICFEYRYLIILPAGNVAFDEE